ncbi:MAG: hypothetical protein ACRDTG_20645 [Pseudonocardiaceae bacterium]
MAKPVVLKNMLREKHWQTYRTFRRQYDKAALTIDDSLVGSCPSRAQLHRWQAGDLKGLPYPHHCQVLEAMFPGVSAAQMFVPSSDVTELIPSATEEPTEMSSSSTVSHVDYGYLLPRVQSGGEAKSWLRVDDGNRAIDATGEEHVTDHKRRMLLISLAAQGGAMSSAQLAQLFDTLREVRLRADRLLETWSVSVATVDRWEAVAHNYGYLELTTSPHTFLTQAIYDFDELQNILSRRQPLDLQKRLYRVMAQLAGLIGIVANDIGPNSQAWFHTAQLAANEIGDRSLQAWATAYESMSYLWWGRPVERAVELSQKAQAIAGSHPNVGGAMAAAMEARAQGRLGRRDEALAAIHRSEAIFERLGTADTATNVLGFYEHFLRFCQETALTSLGETEAALAAQDRALEFSTADVVDSALVRLDRATCLIRDGELTEGCRLAGQTLLDLPTESRIGVPLIRAREVIAVVTPGDGRLESVQSLYEIIRSSSNRRP